MPYEYVRHPCQLQLKFFFQRTLWVHGNKEGIYSVDHHGGEFRCTWREEYKRLCRLGNALRGLGVEVGDKVGCFVWNTHRSGELSFAVPMTGCVFYPINIRYSREHFLYTINNSKDKVMFVDEDLIQLVEGLKDDLKTVKSYIIMTPSKRLPPTTLSPVYSYDELLEQSSDVYDFPDNIPENSLAVLSYTSGTTGLPKGIGWSPRSIILGCLGQCGVDQDEYSEEDVVLIPINLFPANGQNCGWATMMFGGRIIWPGPHPSSAGLLNLIEKEKVTYFRGATTIQAFVMQEWEKGKYDLGSLKKIRRGASAPNKALKEWRESKGERFAW